MGGGSEKDIEHVEHHTFRADLHESQRSSSEVVRAANMRADPHKVGIRREEALPSPFPLIRIAVT
eukprot:978517-Rhodomonas_salina.4